MMLRPIRPNPLMPTFTAIEYLRISGMAARPRSAPTRLHLSRTRRSPEHDILMNGLPEGQTPGYTAAIVARPGALSRAIVS